MSANLTGSGVSAAMGLDHAGSGRRPGGTVRLRLSRRSRGGRCAVVGMTLLTLSVWACSTTKASAPAGTSLPTRTTTSAHTAAEAAAFVKAIYDPYLAASRSEDGFLHTPLLGNCFLPESGRPCPGPIGTYVVPTLASRLQRDAHVGTGSDPVDCAQNTPGRIAYDPPTASDGSATIIVHTYYTGGGEVRITVTVDLATLRVSDLVCSS